MKSILFAAVVGVVTMPVMAADVGVSINVSQPGFYGEINIGGVPQPQVIYPQPVVVMPAPYGGPPPPPIYLRVPPGHQKHWDRHCRDYNACGRQVYFVQESWYQQVYLPQYYSGQGGYRDDDGDEHGGHRGESHGHGHGHDHNDHDDHEHGHH